MNGSAAKSCWVLGAVQGRARLGCLCGMGRWLAAGAVVVATTVAAAGCGSATQPRSAAQSAAPAFASGPVPITVEDAVAAFERDARALEPQAYATGPAESPAEAASPSAPPQPAAQSRRDEAEGGVHGAEGCEVACRSLASMRRSAEHLCSLTGAADPRCSGARARTDAATQRVRAACPECQG
jgi:hypothetical protein